MGYFLYALIAALLATLLYQSTESNNVFTNSSQAPTRVLLLTAHPDDECLFFAPTVLGLVAKKAPAPEVYSLCLSTGNADGLGETRQAELGRSLDVLGIEGDKRWVVDHPELQDNITSLWNPSTIASVLEPYVLEHKITMILTFDHQGISSHPNHQSLPAGAQHFLKNHPSSPPPRLFTLITVPVAAKYTSIMAPFFAKYDVAVSYAMVRFEQEILVLARRFGVLDPLPSPGSASAAAKEGNLMEMDSMPVFISGMHGYWTALRAMRAHESQFVWFRWLNVLFSRYMWVNEWVEVKVGKD